jgi:hypothetical protein
MAATFAWHVGWEGAVWALDCALMSVVFALVKTSTLFALPGWHAAQGLMFPSRLVG